jgi:hypothetical protein
MRWNPNVTRYTWIAIGGVLVYSGIRLMIVQEVPSKIRLDGIPAIEGMPVVFMGLLELALGVFLIWRWWRR